MNALRSLLLFSLSATAVASAGSLRIPVIDGPWRPLADNPALQARLAEQDRTWHFTPDAKTAGRDPLTLKIGATLHSYYSGTRTVTSTLNGKSSAKTVGAVFARTSADGKIWSAAKTVAWGGQAGEDKESARHPVVIEPTPGEFYLFRARIGEACGASGGQTAIYHSADPLDFGLYGNYGDAKHFITAVAPVIEAVVEHEGEWHAVSDGKAARVLWRQPVAPVPATAATRPPGIRIRVALYDDSGSAGAGVPKVTEQLLRCADIEVTKVDRKGIRAGLGGYDVVIFTGGTSGRQANTIGLLGREQVRRFVEAGGGYVGICAGAYLACDGFSWGIPILDAKTPSPKWERGVAELKIESTPVGCRLLGLPRETSVKYHNGPLLVPAGNAAIPDFEPLTYFRTEVAKNGSPEGIMIDSPAIARGTYGKGRVIVCSPHPEQTTGLDGWIEHTVRSVAAE